MVVFLLLVIRFKGEKWDDHCMSLIVLMSMPLHHSYMTLYRPPLQFQVVKYCCAMDPFGFSTLMINFGVIHVHVHTSHMNVFSNNSILGMQ